MVLLLQKRVNPNFKWVIMLPKINMSTCMILELLTPAKVTRSTLQNAASIASMVLTTECIIVDKNDEIVSNKS